MNSEFEDFIDRTLARKLAETGSQALPAHKPSVTFSTVTAPASPDLSSKRASRAGGSSQAPYEPGATLEVLVVVEVAGIPEVKTIGIPGGFLIT